MPSLGASDCERVTAGFLAQPVNAWTSLGFVPAGGVIVARALRAPERRVESMVFGVSVVATGLGSLLYHGPQPSRADTVHDLSILAVLSQVAFHEVRFRMRGGPTERAAALRVALASFGIGAVAFALGRTSSPLCDPDSPVQLHGAWHLLAALSLAAYGRARLEDSF